MKENCYSFLLRLRWAQYYGKCEQTRALSSIRSLKLHLDGVEYERIPKTNIKTEEQSHVGNTGIGSGLCFSLNPFGKANGFMGKRSVNPQPLASMGCQKNSFRGLESVSTKQNVLAGSKKRIENEEEAIENAFDAATTVEELMTAFEAMQSVFDPEDKRLGMACLRIGQEFESAGKDPETILVYAKRALKIFEIDEKNTVVVAMALHLMGSVHCALKKFDESLSYLNRANRILEKLEKEGTEFQVKPIMYAVQVLLGDTKTALGRREEALENYSQSLVLKEAVLEPDHPQLASSYRQVSEAFVAVLRFNEALPLCLKALDLHRKHLGDNSVEVATDRRLLGVIYSGLGEHKKALEENESAKRVLKKWGLTSDLVYAELDSANVQINLGKYDDAINTLRGVVQHTDKESELRALVFLYMGKALCSQEKLADSKKCCDMASNILSKYESTKSPKVASAFTELAMLYETMNEFGTAISLFKKALGIYEKIPQEQHAEASTCGRIGWLLLLTGSVQEAIPYLENAAERLKESFGPQHFGVAYIYNNLGAAYEELERPHAAVQMFAMAKEIMDAALGPHHMDTIETNQNLANVHASMGSLGIAIEFQRHVVEALENHGSSAKDELKEAKRRLADLLRREKQPAGRPYKKALPHHSISGKILTGKKESPDIDVEDTKI
eukprot:Gb_31274 [translate_table: standard]